MRNITQNNARQCGEVEWWVVGGWGDVQGWPGLQSTQSALHTLAAFAHTWWVLAAPYPALQGAISAGIRLYSIK